MNTKYLEDLSKLNDELQLLELETDSPVCLAEMAIPIVFGVLEMLKSDIKNNGFPSIEEEIHFFKHVKPLFLSKLIYYNRIYKIETRKPQCGKKMLRKYFRKEQKRINLYFEDNLDFHKYVKSSDNCQDRKYFTRGKFDIKQCLNSSYFSSDMHFNTSHDNKSATILSNELILIFLESSISQLKHSKRIDLLARKEEFVPKNTLSWTAKKVALIELIYALFIDGAFNNGNADLTEIVKAFEIAFQIDLGNFSRTFSEIKSRKMSRIKYLEVLTEKLISKMDESDDF